MYLSFFPIPYQKWFQAKLRASSSPSIASRLSHLVLLLAFLASTTVAAQTTLPLAKALQLSLANNSELQRYPFERSKNEALLLQAGFRPVASAELSVENALGSGEYAALDASETTLTLSQVIELGDKRQRRINVSRARQDQLASEYELSRLDVLAETSRRYLTVLTLQAQRLSNNQRLQEEQQALTLIKKRSLAGASSAADVAKLDLRLALSKAQAEQLYHAHTQARGRLAAMWQAEADFEQVAGQLSALPNMPALSALLAAIEQSPRLQQQLALQRLADSRLQLAQANGRNDVTVGLGLRHLEASNDQALVFSLAMPLGFKNPNRGRIKAALADQQRSNQTAATVQQNLRLELVQIHQQLLGNQARSRQLRDELLPRALTLIKHTQRGLQQGQYSILAWTDAQAERFAFERELIDLYSTMHLQILELERISNQPLATIAQGDTL